MQLVLYLLYIPIPMWKYNYHLGDYYDLSNNI